MFVLGPLAPYSFSIRKASSKQATPPPLPLLWYLTIRRSRVLELRAEAAEVEAMRLFMTMMSAWTTSKDDSEVRSFFVFLFFCFSAFLHFLSYDSLSHYVESSFGREVIDEVLAVAAAIHAM